MSSSNLRKHNDISITASGNSSDVKPYSLTALDRIYSLVVQYAHTANSGL